MTFWKWVGHKIPSEGDFLLPRLRTDLIKCKLTRGRKTSFDVWAALASQQKHSQDLTGKFVRKTLLLPAAAAHFIHFGEVPFDTFLVLVLVLVLVQKAGLGRQSSDNNNNNKREFVSSFIFIIHHHGIGQDVIVAFQV